MARKMTGTVTLKLSNPNKRHQKLTLTPQWITNNHWAIRREYVANAHLIDADSVAHPERYRQLNADAVHRMLFMPDSVSQRTPTAECRLQPDRSLTRIFIGPDGERSGFGLNYLDQFAPVIGADPVAYQQSNETSRPGFFAFQGVAHETIADDNVVLVLMPMRL